MKTVFEDGAARLELIDEFVGNEMFDRLLHTISWQQNEIKIFGRKTLEPRLTAWYGPPYRYSGIAWPAHPLPDVLLDIKEKTEWAAGYSFNSCLLNFYRNGLDSMGWHRDNEPEMDVRCIASISLGATRDFQFRKGKKGAVVNLSLPGGSLLLMHHFQQDYYHAIPKRKNNNQGRINLTFRHIKEMPGTFAP